MTNCFRSQGVKRLTQDGREMQSERIVLMNAEPTKREDRRLMTVKQAAMYCGTSYSSMYQLIKNGRIPSVRFNRRLLVDKTDLDAFIERHKQ